MYCASLKPETLCSLGYLDLCLWQLNYIRGTEFRIFTLGRNAIIHSGKCKSTIQTVRSVKLHLIETCNIHLETTPGSWVLSNYLKRWVNCLYFLHTQAKLFTSTYWNKNMPRVFSPQVCQVCFYIQSLFWHYWKPEHLFWTFEVPDWYFICALPIIWIPYWIGAWKLCEL